MDIRASRGIVDVRSCEMVVVDVQLSLGVGWVLGENFCLVVRLTMVTPWAWFSPCRRL